MQEIQISADARFQEVQLSAPAGSEAGGKPFPSFVSVLLSDGVCFCAPDFADNQTRTPPSPTMTPESAVDLHFAWLHSPANSTRAVGHMHGITAIPIALLRCACQGECDRRSVLAAVQRYEQACRARKPLHLFDELTVTPEYPRCVSGQDRIRMHGCMCKLLYERRTWM